MTPEPPTRPARLRPPNLVVGTTSPNLPNPSYSPAVRPTLSKPTMNDATADDLNFLSLAVTLKASFRRRSRPEPRRLTPDELSKLLPDHDVKTPHSHPTAIMDVGHTALTSFPNLQSLTRSRRCSPDPACYYSGHATPVGNVKLGPLTNGRLHKYALTGWYGDIHQIRATYPRKTQGRA